MRRVLTLLAFAALLPLTASAQTPPLESILGREVELSLDDAISLALENNLNLVVARTEPAIADERLRQSEGIYDPRLVAGNTFTHAETPVSNPNVVFFLGSTAIEADVWNYNTGFSGVLPVGLSYSSNYNMTRTESSFSTLLPEWQARWVSELRLPLLRDLIHNEASIAVQRSRLARDISEEDFQRLLTDEVQRVETAYWELSASIEGLRIAEKSLETARSLRDQTQVQYEVGVVSRVAVTQADAGVAEREVNRIRARNRHDRAQDDLLNVVAAPDQEGYAQTRIRATDPTYVEFEVDLAAAVDRAMELRPELATARHRVGDATAQLDLALNQRLPSFDLVASYTASGLSGSVNDDAPFAIPSGLVPEGSRDAHQKFFRAGGAHGWSVGAQVEIPFPNTTARALTVQRRIELRRARTELRREQQRVLLETREAARNLQSAIEGIQAEERRRDAASEALRAEQEKLRLGDSTPHDVLEFEEQVAESENGLTAALQLYRNTITALERAQGTLLRSRRISLEAELGR